MTPAAEMVVKLEQCLEIVAEGRFVIPSRDCEDFIRTHGPALLAALRKPVAYSAVDSNGVPFGLSFSQEDEQSRVNYWRHAPAGRPKEPMGVIPLFSLTTGGGDA